MKQTKLTLATGALVLPVERDGKRVGEVRLVPDDTAFLARFYALLPKMEQHRAALAEGLAAAGDDTQAAFDEVNTVWCALQKELDEVFGAGTAALVFGGVQSFALVQQFFEGVAQALRTVRAPLLEQYTNPTDGVLS